MMKLLEENQTTNLENLVGANRVGLTRRGFISAGALCGAAMFLGGNILSRTALANSVSAASGALLGF